jgi:hypothetical protein
MIIMVASERFGREEFKEYMFGSLFCVVCGVVLYVCIISALSAGSFGLCVLANWLTIFSANAVIVYYCPHTP